MFAIENLSVHEASFVSGMSLRDFNRMIDEKLLPKQLIVGKQGKRRVSPLGVAMAVFYLKTSNSLSASFRKKIIQSAVKIVESDEVNKDEFKLPVDGAITNGELVIEMNMIQVDVGPYINEIRSKLRSISAVREFVSQDKSVMSGRPVFRGTRLPIDLIVDANGMGLTLLEAKEAYPFITKEHLDAASTFMKLNPQRGRPRRLPIYR